MAMIPYLSVVYNVLYNTQSTFNINDPCQQEKLPYNNSELKFIKFSFIYSSA